jgi:hypothetical protein
MTCNRERERERERKREKERDGNKKERERERKMGKRERLFAFRSKPCWAIAVGGYFLRRFFFSLYAKKRCRFAGTFETPQLLRKQFCQMITKYKSSDLGD